MLHIILPRGARPRPRPPQAARERATPPAFAAARIRRRAMRATPKNASGARGGAAVKH